MDIVLRGQHLPTGRVLRYAAAACGASLVAGWLVFLVLEAIRNRELIPYIHSHNQAIALAVVFSSYVIGWRHELIGALLAVVGTLAFFAVGRASVEVLPPLAAAWFAAPGVLYLAAWLANDRH